jgi:hypothetical protein
MGNSELLVARAPAPAPAPARGTTAALDMAAASCVAAAATCRAWEAGGDAASVTDTAAVARAAANIALESVITDEPWDRSCEEPVTRQARLAYSAWFALLAGTDEDGTARDLDCAAELFYGAAAA